MAIARPFTYGGQALIEGVLIVGRTGASMAVRRPGGAIWTGVLSISPLVTGRLRRVPLVRGVLVLAETLTLGIRALNRSAELAMAEGDGPDGEAPPPGVVQRSAVVGSLLVAMALGVGLFFLLPLAAARAMDPAIGSALGSNLVEGGIRLGLLVGYIWGIGKLGDVRRVFAYHGAEHMTIHAYEHGAPLKPEEIERFPTAHPRCGTAFLLTVVVVSVLVFALVGRPSLWVAAASRVALVPVIAAVAYELVRFSGLHAESRLGRLMALPGLALQRMTTRRPDHAQIEVAVAALSRALEADGQSFDAKGQEGDAQVPASARDDGPHRGRG